MQETEGSPIPAEKQNSRFDRSDFIAFIALAISILGTVISMQETAIMNQQHELMAEQKAASAWPYLDNETDIEYQDSTITISYSIVNKGIGPAIVGGVKIFYEDQEIEVYSVGQIISQYVPGVAIQQTQSYKIDNSVLAPNDFKRLITLVAERKQEFYNALPRIEKIFRVEFCYCSIYGDCWTFPQDGWPQPTQDCEIDVYISNEKKK